MKLGLLYVIVILSDFCTADDMEQEIENLKQLIESIDEEYLLKGTYCHEKLGCFPTDGVWEERGYLLNFNPNSRETIDTQFKLFTRANPTESQPLVADEPRTVRESYFDARKLTKFVVHGFLASADSSWFKSMNKELLSYGDFNVINVDWGGLGGSKTAYVQATANTRVVGAEIAYLIRVLQKVKDLKAADVHIIGHSLGAQIAGYAGAATKGLGRISGLDPAGPHFQGYHTKIRLDKSDAVFVDIIHSDADPITKIATGGGFGTKDLSGHADFFPNGGQDQPNCLHLYTTNGRKVTEADLYKRKQFMACDHSRAVEYYIKSINKCSFVGIICKDFRNFINAKCSLKCSSIDHCNKMGFHAHKPQDGTRTYYLRTTGTDPFCANQRKVTIAVDRKIEKIKVTMQLTLRGKKAQVINLAKEGESLLMNGGQSYEYFVGVSNELGTVTSLDVHWEKDLAWWKIFSWGSSSIEINEITLITADGKIEFFCGSDIEISSGVLTRLPKKRNAC